MPCQVCSSVKVLRLRTSACASCAASYVSEVCETCGSEQEFVCDDCNTICNPGPHAALYSSTKEVSMDHAIGTKPGVVDAELGVPLDSILAVATRDGTTKRRNAATKHLSHFFQAYCAEDYTSWRDVPLASITHDVLQQFATYLARHATVGMKPGAALISYNTADTILSQVKVAIQLLHGVNQDLLFLEGSSWARIRASLKSVFTIRNISSGLPMMTPHATASQDDLLSLSKVCIWSGDEKASNFLLFLQSLVQCVGRGSEVAMIRHTDITVASVREMKEWNIFKIRLWRQKTSNEQELAVFAHAETMHKDWMFAYAYFLVMSSSQSPHIFPDLADMAKVDHRTQQLNTSGISKGVERLLKKYSAIATQYASMDDEFSEVNPSLGGHSWKKLGVEMSNDSPAINPTWTCFRAGWVTRNLHTIFDYLTGTPSNDKKVGKVLSGWVVADCRGEIAGGMSPEIPHRDSLNATGPKVDRFSRLLFSQYLGSCPERPFTMDDRTRDLLTATILRYYKDFCYEVAIEPQGKWSTQSHPFLSTILYAAEKSGLSSTDLGTLCTQVNEDFIQCNYSYLSWNFLASKGATRSTAIDTRNLQGSLHYINDSMMTIASDVMKLKEASRQYPQSFLRLENKIDKILSLLKSNTRQGDPPQSEIDGAHQNTEMLRTNLPQSIQGLTMLRLFQDWHTYDYPAQYSRRQGQNARIFSNMKRAMEFFVLFVVAPLPSKPEDAEINAVYLSALSDIARCAIAKIVQQGWIGDPEITVTSFAQVFTNLSAEKLKLLPLGWDEKKGTVFLEREQAKKSKSRKRKHS